VKNQPRHEAVYSSVLTQGNRTLAYLYDRAMEKQDDRKMAPPPGIGPATPESVTFRHNK